MGVVIIIYICILYYRFILDPCVDHLQAQSLGIALPVVGHFSHVVWADNILSMGHSLDAVVHMGQDSAGCLLYTLEAQLLATLGDDSALTSLRFNVGVVAAGKFPDDRA